MNKDPETTSPAQPEPTPEVDRLLKILEIQSAASRERFRPSPLQTNSFRYGALIAIAVFAFGALGILEWFLSQLPHPTHAATPVSTPVGAQSGRDSADNFHN